MIIQYGLKLWSINTDLAEDAGKLICDDLFQYVELMPVPGTSIEPFVGVNVPYIIHITTEKFGLNISDDKKHDMSLRMINDCMEWADRLNADYLILHPGFGNIGSALALLDRISDRRVLIENMPVKGMNGEAMLGYGREQLEQLAGGKFGFCLDFGHAIKAAFSCGIDYRLYIKDLIKLKPKVFHISDGTHTYEKDEHLGIGQGDYDMRFLLSSIGRMGPGYITLETPRARNMLDEDVCNLMAIKQCMASDD